MRKANIITAVFFILFIFSSLIANIILPDTLYSETEKRDLAQMPELTWHNIVSGEFMEKFDVYVSEQFYGRSSWVLAKSMSQYFVGLAKLNGVYITSGRYMRELNIDYGRLSNNLDAIVTLSEKSGVPVTLIIVPEAATVYGVSSKEEKVIEKVYEKLDGKVNVFYPKEILKNHADEYIYFKGDHHWTMKGALYAYNEFRNSDKEYEFITVADDFTGSMVTKAGVKMPWISLDRIEVPVGIDNNNFAISVNRGGADEDWNMFYPEFLGEFDKYRYFLGGDQPLMAIGANGEGSALVIKDSFANVMLPYLAGDYRATYVVDTRYNRQSQAEYAKAMGVDEIILIYSPDSLCNEFSLVNLGN